MVARGVDDADQLRAFVVSEDRILKNTGVEVTVRREMGSDINAACGQLRRSYIKENDIKLV